MSTTIFLRPAMCLEELQQRVEHALAEGATEITFSDIARAAGEVRELLPLIAARLVMRGVEIDYVEYAPIPPVNMGIQSGRFRYPPEGLFGGGAGSKARFLINGRPGNPYGLNHLYPADVIIMETAGGGGYGDPLERDLAMVESDVMDGYISIESARDDYGIIVDPETKSVDPDATRELRESLKIHPKHHL